MENRDSGPYRPGGRRGEDRKSGEAEAAGIFRLFVQFLVVVTAGILIAAGLHMAFWALDMAELILQRPEQVALIEPFISATGKVDANIIQVQVVDDMIMIRDNVYLRTFVILVLLFIVFNIVGRVIGALISGAVNLVVAILDPRKKRKG